MLHDLEPLDVTSMPEPLLRHGVVVLFVSAFAPWSPSFQEERREPGASEARFRLT